MALIKWVFYKMRNLELPGRSPVVTTNGMAATSHYLATETAVSVLKKGGNAMDAAVAACAVQCVVEPGSTGIGGDCFCIYAPNGGTDYVAYNGSGRAAAAATKDWYAGQNIKKIELDSPHSVTIPGAVDAWDRLITDHGKMSLADLLKPAIKFASDGYPISSRVAFDFARNADKLKSNDAAADVFLKDGMPPVEGDVHTQPKLARSMELIARNGRDGFYQSEIAEDIVSCLHDLGGLQTLEDFREAKGEYVTPISARYKGYDVYQCPPNGQGVIALMLLKLMEKFPRNGNNPINFERIHQEIEAGKLAYHQRDAYLADPDQANVPVAELLSDENIDRMFALIKRDGVINNLPKMNMPAHRDTVYITVVDKDRNACSFINTLFHGFGSGIMAPNSGVMLQNRGAGFTLEAGHPNVIAPYKRPLHTIIPAMVAKDGRTVMSYGVMGGSYQAFGHMQFLSRFLDYGVDIQEAMDLPRFFPNSEIDTTEIESAVGENICAELTKLGHNIGPASIPIGGSQAIWIDHEKGTLTGGSDPRKDGCALGY